MTPISRLFLTGLAGLCLVLSAGCVSSPAHDSSLYVLDNGPAPADGAPVADAPTLTIDSVRVADYLNQGGIVFQTAPYKIVIANNNRWAAPLSPQLTDTLYNVISRRLHDVNVRRSASRRAAAYTLSTRVERFYGSRDGKAHISGVWQLMNPDGDILRSENFERQVDLERDGYDALVASLSQGWQAVAADMAPPIDASLSRRDSP